MCSAYSTGCDVALKSKGESSCLGFGQKYDAGCFIRATGERH